MIIYDSRFSKYEENEQKIFKLKNFTIAQSSIPQTVRDFWNMISE